MKSIFTLLIVLISFSLNSFSKLEGQARVDSLEAEIPKAIGDTNHVNLLSMLSYAYASTNPNKGIEYAEKGLELAKQINWTTGQAKSYNKLGTNYYWKADYSNSLRYWSKALEIFEKLGNRIGVAENLGNIGIIYTTQSDYRKALECYNQALEVNTELRNKTNMAVNLSNIGIIHKNQANYSKAYEYYSKALGIFEELDDSDMIANMLTNIGVVYATQSSYSEALEYYFRALKIIEEVGDKVGEAYILGNIGIIYSDQAEYVKALEYYYRAMEIDEELGQLNGVSRHLGNIGLIYTKQSEYDKALKVYERAIRTHREVGNKSGEARTFGNIGIVYAERSDYAKALKYFNNSLMIHREVGDKVSVIANLGNMGKLYFDVSQDTVDLGSLELNEFISLNKEINLNKSIEHLSEAIDFGREIGEMKHRTGSLITLANGYKMKGLMVKAYAALEEHHLLKDSIVNNEKSKEIGKLEAQREQLEKDIEAQKAARTRKEAISKRDRLQYLAIGSVVVAFGVLLLLSGRMKLKEWVARALVFLSFIFLFEFILVILDPFTNELSEGVPIVKFGINMTLALIIFPMHQYFEKRVSKKVLGGKEQATVESSGDLEKQMDEEESE